MKLTGTLKNVWIKAATKRETIRNRTMFATIRHIIASRYLKGEGIEIGALHNPLHLSPDAAVRYVDKWSAEELAATYPELRYRKLVKVDVIDDGETLETFAASSLDFIIANHLLEHCRNPLRTIERMFSLLKTEGVLFLTVPDKRYTFDAPRPVTPTAHLIREYREGTAWSEEEHVAEYVRNMFGLADEGAIREKVRQLRSDLSGCDLHWHVWTQDEVLELITACKREVGLSFETELFFRNGDFEVIFLLRKSAP